MSPSRCLLLALCAAVSVDAHARRSIPLYLLDPASQHPDHPTAQAICGLGTSADDLEAALEAARGSVSRQIASTIEGTTERVSEVARTMEGHLTASRQLNTTITEQYAFDYAELIRTVAIEQPTRKDPLFRALACLDRAEAAERILQDHQPSLQAFDLAVSQAQAALAGGDLPGFAAPYAQARPLADEIQAARPLVGVISPTHLTALDARLSSQSDLDSHAASLRAGARVAVVVQDADATHARQIEGALQQALGILGVGTTTAATQCGVAETTHVLGARAETTCARGYVALSCQLRVSLEIAACGTGLVQNGLIEDEAFQGMSNQFQEAPALEAAWAGVEGAPLVPHLSSLLQGLIPLP